ncbi:hypothetical protein [Actinomadura rubrisoli]|uniref:DUF1795 domain-containing protein n=1 Tax=Actinomadura rubrisoli TaxID=2530368 RepID=A0A4R5ACJ6_9ACTN|nr:hypothetical protein [Actinomadura rubrisoli]TDD69415.1 hypothetical protein E1298_37460 [Actinomadura rubrisoli]
MESMSRLTACALAALLVAGCSSGEKKPPAPPGSREYRTDAYTFAYPSTWTPRTTTEEGGAPVLKVDGPELPSGVYDGQVHVGRRDRHAGGLADQLSQFRGLAQLNGYRVTAVRETKLDGAADARRIEARYEITTQDGTRTPMRLLGLYALTKRRTLLEFMIRSPERGTAAAQAPAILASFRLTGGR